MGASAENFCLRWNDFEANVSSSFRELRDESDLFDVTLVTADSGNQTLQAHKVILSACSIFFKQMLRQQSKLHNHPNPLIFLRGVTYNDLLYVLDFMYHGEVNVAQEDLNSFLAVAEELQIKGLTNKDQAEAGTSNDKLSKFMAGRLKDRGGPPPKRIRKSSDHSQLAPGSSTSSNDGMQNVAVKIDPEVTMSVDPDEAVNTEDPEGFDDTYGDYYDETSGAMEGDGADATKGPKDIPGLSRLEGGAGQCLVCGKYFRHFRSAKHHFKTTHLMTFHCGICKTVAKNARHLSDHMRRCHSDPLNSQGFF